MSVAIQEQPKANPASSAQSFADDQWGRLMEAAQAGNGGAYNRLLNEVQPWLVRYYSRRLPLHMVDDAAQDTLMAIHQKRHTYEPGRPFRPWLAGIARYKWIDRLRAMGRQHTVSLDDEIFEPSVEGHESKVTTQILLNEFCTKLKSSQI